MKELSIRQDVWQNVRLLPRERQGRRWTFPPQSPLPVLESVSLAEEEGWGPREGQRMHLAGLLTSSSRNGAEGVRGAHFIVGGKGFCFSCLLPSSLFQETTVVGRGHVNTEAESEVATSARSWGPHPRFYRWRNWGPKRCRDLPEVIMQVGRELGLGPGSYGSQEQLLNPHPSQYKHTAC